MTIFTTLGAVLCFLLPLRGMHNRIVAEKKRLLGEVNTRIEAAIQQVYRRADGQNLNGFDQLNQLMASLVKTREVIEKISTWPWETATLTGFISAFLLPFVIGLIRLLMDLFVF